MKYFAHRFEDTFNHVFPDVRLVSMCGTRDVIPVDVREAEEGEQETHWGWWEQGKPYPSMIQLNRAMLQLCFPAALEEYEARGRGRAVRLIVGESVSKSQE